MESIFNLRPFSQKMENFEIYIFVPNSEHIEFIKSLIQSIQLLMIRLTIHQCWIDINTNAKSQLQILGTDHQLFGKQSKKSGEILH